MKDYKSIQETFEECFGGSFDTSSDELMHVGVGHDDNPPGRGSGRYAYGEGDQAGQHKAGYPYTTSGGFSGEVERLRAQGWTEKEICDAFHMSTTEFRRNVTVEKNLRIRNEQTQCRALLDEGKTPAEIARITGLPDSTVRTRLDEIKVQKTNEAFGLADTLKEHLADKEVIDIGEGVDKELGVSREKLDAAAAALEQQGYRKETFKIEQATNSGKFTTLNVLVDKDSDISWSDLVHDPSLVKTINDYNVAQERNGVKRSTLNLVRPATLDSSRVYIRYPSEGGSDKDGVIELRKGVEDISLGDAHYAQVRINVDDKAYLKGVAMYSDDIPEGFDVVFNTSKPDGTPAFKTPGYQDSVFKGLKTNKDKTINWENPFGATIKTSQITEDGVITGGQSTYVDANGENKLRVINKVNEEGDWDRWSKNLPSQFLSKQPIKLIHQQLDLSYQEKADEYNEIMSVQNTALRKKMLYSFADDCDSAAVDLKAAALPGQKPQVILPLANISENEIYAPNFKNGEMVALVRYPHAGGFEIPVLKVNNKFPDGVNNIGDTKDCVGISPKSAKILSGADFDGDTATVIPIRSNKIISSKDYDALPCVQSLRDFDPNMYKRGDDEVATVDEKGWNKGRQMGVITNLIMDMSLQGAEIEEIVRADKFSMVIIDAEKHNLNYQQAYKDFEISELQLKYQGKARGGASTIISKAKKEVRNIPERKQVSPTRDWDPETGKVNYELSNRMKSVPEETDENGKVTKWGKALATQTGTMLGEADDAMTLVRNPYDEKERAYANYSNSLKALANEARKSYLATPTSKVDPEAKKTYAAEVKSLEEKLRRAQLNAPRERQAQIIATVNAQAQRANDPAMTKEEYKRAKSQALAAARLQVDASRQKIELTDSEWEALSAHAIGDTKQQQIFNNCDMDKVKERAVPLNENALSNTKQMRIRSLIASGATAQEVADQLGISVSTVRKYANSD